MTRPTFHVPASMNAGLIRLALVLLGLSAAACGVWEDDGPLPPPPPPPPPIDCSTVDFAKNLDVQASEYSDGDVVVDVEAGGPFLTASSASNLDGGSAGSRGDAPDGGQYFALVIVPYPDSTTCTFDLTLTCTSTEPGSSASFLVTVALPDAQDGGALDGGPGGVPLQVTTVPAQ